MEKKLRTLCFDVRDEIEHGTYEKAYELAKKSMSEYPNSGIPHNLIGILEECRNNHISAMKHFRAAWALDPTFLPARWNLELYGGLNKGTKCAYVEEDVPKEQNQPGYKHVYDEKENSHMVRQEES